MFCDHQSIHRNDLHIQQNTQTKFEDDLPSTSEEIKV